MPLYLLRVSLDHTSFRLPSLLSVAELFSFDLRIVSSDPTRSVLVVELDNEEQVNHILDRATLVMSACELFAQGSNYDELHSNVKSELERYEPYRHSSFRFNIGASNYRIPLSRQTEIITDLSYLNFRGPIKMNDPEVEWVVFEDYDLVEQETHIREVYEQRLGQFRTVYFGRRIGHSRARPLITTQSIKTRQFYGNTSMEAEMSFLMAGQALPSQGKLVYDPFAGTGSLLYACAHWGAYTLASDIDARQMRGKGKGKGVVPGMLRSAKQYAVEDKFLDMACLDMTQHPWRRGGWVDAIVTDPPYGVRAGAKRLGKRETRKKPPLETAFLLPDGTPAHQKLDYIPPCKPYELTHLTLDLIQLARYLLVPMGRLVFFLPTTSEEYSKIDLPIVEGMREVRQGGDCVQDFGSWGRRMITMEKTATDDGQPPQFNDYSSVNGMAGIKQFREKYFEGFHKHRNDSPPAQS